ncbi:MAG: hypothetical protein ACK5MV_13925 [Aminipila sp.]
MLREVAATKMDALKNSFASTRLQVGLLVGGIKAFVNTKVTTAISGFNQFKNTVTEGRQGLAGLTTSLKNVAKISIANTYNSMKKLATNFKEFASVKLSSVVNKLKEFRNGTTGATNGANGLFAALKKAASVSFSALTAGLGKVGAAAKSAGSYVAKGFGAVTIGTVKGLGMATAALGAGAVAAAGGIYKLSTMASTLAESQNVVSATFGEGAVSGMTKWAQGMANAAGVSETNATKWVGSMGAMLKTSGIAAKELPGMSQNMVQLAGDMASFYNLDNEEAWNKIRSGISGETEPLKQLGINMSVANLEAYAMSKGIKKSYNAMSQAEQTQLRYNYLMGVTADAQGDFKKTLDGSLANQVRVLGLNFQTAGTNIGKIFMPAVLGATKSLNGYLTEANEVLADGWQTGDDKKLADIFTRMLDSGVKALETGLPKVVNTVVTITNTLVGAFIKALPSAVPVLLNGAVQIFNSVIEMVKQNTAPLVELAVSVVTSLANFLLDAIPQIILVGADILIGFVQGMVAQLPQIISTAAKAIKTMADGLVARMPMIIQTAIQLIQTLAQGLIDNLPMMIHAAIQLIGGLLSGLVSKIPQLVQTAIQLIRTIQDSVWACLPQIIQTGVQLIVSLVQGVVQSIPMIIDGMIQGLQAFITTIINNLPLIIQAAVQIVVALAVGLIQAIPQLIAAIVDTIMSTNWLQVGWDIVKGIGKGLFDGVKSIFGGGGKEGGEAAANGAASGLTSNLGTINTASQTAANSITTGLQPDFTAINGYGMTATTGLATGLTEGATGLNTTAMQLGTDASTNIATGLSTGTSTINTAAMQLGTDTVTGLSTGITDSIGLATEAATSTATVVTNEFKDIDLYDCGTNAMQGFVNGLNAMKSSVMSVANGIAQSVKTTINSALDIHSPSRVMEETGEYTGQGLVVGINKTLDSVRAASNDLSNCTMASLPGYAGIGNINPGGATGGGKAITINNQFAFDTEVVLGDVGNKDPQTLAEQILSVMYGKLKDADSVLSQGEMALLL